MGQARHESGDHGGGMIAAEADEEAVEGDAAEGVAEAAVAAAAAAAATAATAANDEEEEEHVEADNAVGGCGDAMLAGLNWDHG
jgi:hypothetical protein